MSSNNKNNTVNEKEVLRQNILMDIYLYEKELLDNNLRNEDKQYIKEKIEEAENLFKSI